MFKNEIRATALNSDAANQYFRHITFDRFNHDDSFEATLRALVAPRMKAGETLTGCIHTTTYSADVVKSVPVKRLLEAMCDCDRLRDTIVIENIASETEDDRYACLMAAKSSFEQVFNGWHIIQKVTDFYRKAFFVLCFINPDTRSVYVLVDNLSPSRLHYLQCSIFAFLPWFFDPNEGVSELEMELINSLREKTSTKYEECIAKIAAQYDFRTQRIRQLLDGFEHRYERIQAQQERNNIQYCLDKIDILMDQVSQYMKSKRDAEIRLLGLTAKSEQSGEDSEIMEYFLCNKNVVLTSVDDCSMQFACKEYVEYFDEDMAKKMIDNQRSYVYRPNGRLCNNIIPAEDMKMLMYALFIDCTLRMKFCAAYTLELDGVVRAIAGYGYGYEFVDCTPNTHIDRYRCMGNYQNTINKCLKDRDYIGAVAQCIASCKSLNFADSTVMEEFMRRMYGTSEYPVNMNCIELPDGTITNPKGAIAWLKKQKEGASNE